MGTEGESRFGFTGHETDFGSGLVYAGARYYDPETGRWLQTDPMADEFAGWSPYNYALNSPMIITDPSGASASPIYDQDGNLLGTDDFGLQGNAIVMDKSDFQQGMSHYEALRKNMGVDGLNGDEALRRLGESYGSLMARPDYDGKIGFREAVSWYNEGGGKPLYIDASTFDLSPLTVKDVKNAPNGYINTFGKTDTDTGGVIGTVKFTLLDEATGLVRIGRVDNNQLDTYDFKKGSLFGKIGGVPPGAEKPYIIYCYVCTARVSTEK